MPGVRDFITGVFRQRKSPQQWAGVPGFSIYGGWVDHEERDKELQTHDGRHKAFADILTNTSIVAASVRYYLNLIAKSEWSFEPAEADGSGEYAERLEEILTSDPRTPWHRIVRRAAMFRFYGFSVQEWRVRRREDGWLTYSDVRPRPQATIERWDVDEDGEVQGMVQRNPQDHQYFYIPRGKTLYLVDDALSDSPQGLGIFRHLVSPSDRLKRYEQLEGFGFEVDLRNVPLAKIPIQRINDAVAAGDLSRADADKMIQPIIDFVKNHVKNPQTGLAIDSAVYEGQDDAQRPSTTPMYGMELLSGSQTSLPESAQAIERLNREMARIMGTEQLLLGSDSKGSFALSKDKTGQFYLLIDAGLTEVREAVAADLVDPIWMLNGWPEDLKPELRTEAVRARDVEEIAMALKDMSTAGAPLLPDDPVVNQVRDLMGVERVPEDSDFQRLLDGMAGDRGGNEPPDDDDDVPENEEDEE